MTMKCPARNSDEVLTFSLKLLSKVKFYLKILGEALPSDLDIDLNENSDGSQSGNDEMDDSEWNMMGAELEREFLGLEK